MEFSDNLRLYTVKEVAAVLKVSKTEIQNLEKDRMLMPIDWSDTVNNARKRRRFVRYSHDDLIKFITGKK